MFVKKTYIKKCIICGKSFETLSVKALTCGKDCRNIYNRRKRKEQREKTHRNSSIEDVSKEARKAGLSYGKYVAAVEKK